MACGERVEVSQARRSGGRRGAHGAVVAERLCTASPQPRASRRRRRCGPRRAGRRAARWCGRARRTRLPIAGSESPVSSRARYMATCRGQAMRGVRAVERSSSVERPKCCAGGGLDLGDRARTPRPARRAGDRGWSRTSRASSAVERAPGQRAEGDDADQRALERAHVARRRARRSRASAPSSARLDAVVVGALAQDRQAGGEVGRAGCRRRGRPRSARAGGPRAPAGRAAGGRR